MTLRKSAAHGLADALFKLLEAKQNLDDALERIPDYTGDKSREWFYETEQQVYDQAVMDFAWHVADISDDIATDILKARDLI